MLPTRKEPHPPRIRPVPMTCDDAISTKIPDPLPKGCFRMLVIGAPGSGKTSLATSLLLKNGAYHRVFDRIHVVQPSNSRASYAKDPWAKHRRVYDDLTPELLERVLGEAKSLAADDKHSLLFIDDFAYTLKDRKIERLLRECFFNARHAHLSTIIVSQTLRSVPDKLRKSASHVILFSPANRVEAKIAAEELLFLDTATAATLFEQAFKEQFDFMLIDTQRRRVWRNFDEEIQLPRAF